MVIRQRISQSVGVSTMDVQEKLILFAAQLVAEKEIQTLGCPPWITKPMRAIIGAVQELKDMAPPITVEEILQPSKEDSLE
jgi:hypothetical protein